MRELDTLKPQIDNLTHRIETMSDDKREFEAAARRARTASASLVSTA
jgi:hypothetical protein